MSRSLAGVASDGAVELADSRTGRPEATMTSGGLARLALEARRSIGASIGSRLDSTAFRQPRAPTSAEIN